MENTCLSSVKLIAHNFMYIPYFLCVLFAFVCCQKEGGNVCNLAAERAAKNNYVREVAAEMRQSPRAVMETVVDTRFIPLCHCLNVGKMTSLYCQDLK